MRLNGRELKSSCEDETQVSGAGGDLLLPVLAARSVRLMARTNRAKTLKRQAEMDAQARRERASNVCGATKSGGSMCARAAGWGTGHKGYGRCRHHAGMTRGGAIAAAREEMGGMAKPANVSAQQALRAVLRLAAGQLAYASARSEPKLTDRGVP